MPSTTKHFLILDFILQIYGMLCEKKKPRDIDGRKKIFIYLFILIYFFFSFFFLVLFYF